ncbi:Endoglucanase A [Mycena venus]|uniref:Endoglucanase A n=1 Tax=Mycena venus TaxID=2733690 RepID=A0A8H6TWK5_9AGAR|nr:Endoglucanase A [Mycena venus]
MRSLLLLSAAAIILAADITVYTDGALAAGWEDWSWDSTINYAATDQVEGTSSISVNSTAYGAFSPKYDGGLFTGYAGLQFDIAGDNPDLIIAIVSSADGSVAATIPLSSLSTSITLDAFTTLKIDFNDLPGIGGALPNGSWDRLWWQAGTNGDIYHLDNIYVVQEVVVTPEDITVYTDGALAAGWEDWSWGSTINYAATDLYEGTSSITINSTAYSAFSPKYDGGLFTGYAGLQFDIAGNNPDLTIAIVSSTDGSTAASITLSSLSTNITPDAFTTLLIDFNDLPVTGGALPNGTWDRIWWQAGPNGDAYHLDNIYILGEIVVTPLFLSAEPLAANTIAVTTQGSVDFSTLTVSLNGQTLKITNTTTYVPAGTPSKSITYLTLAENFAPGTLLIDTGVLNGGNSTFNFNLPTVQYLSIVQQVNYPISPDIYGVNFPVDAQYIQDLGVTMARWGGNAVTAYNPAGQFTNAGNDWYFENRVADPPDADAWVGWVQGAGASTLLTIPSLDWVAKDATSYSYHESVYPDQQSSDPFLPDAGDGLFPNGSYITPVPDPTNVYAPWNTSMAKAWLKGLANKPTLVAIDNEIEIASNTHQDMHPMRVDCLLDELSRVLKNSLAAKEALPEVLVAAPSTCAWWYYWTSQVGYTDNAAHDNIDFLPWFLMQMATAEKTYGKRLLDYLDIHYYYAADTSANDDAAKALRLRMTRSLWDTTYVDESWIGIPPQQNHQWDNTIVQLIPRFRTLIDINYPDTKLSISEFSSTADTDITGGLVTVDMLGIFGQQHLDSATYWEQPDELGPIGLAYWLYRGYGTYFGANSAQVNLATPNPDTQGVYAGTENGKLTLVIVNKNPDTPITFALANMPFGEYFIRHFGGQAGIAKWQTTVSINSIDYIVIPAYTAVFFSQN